MDKSYLMELKLSELKTETQKEVFFRYLSIAEHYISTENEKEAKEILKNLGFDKKTSTKNYPDVHGCQNYDARDTFEKHPIRFRTSWSSKDERVSRKIQTRARRICLAKVDMWCAWFS